MQWTDGQIAKANEDFRVFLYIVWREVGLPAPTPIQYSMADYLQHPPSDRIILEGFRGVAKSFITCAYSVWRLWRNPQIKVWLCLPLKTEQMPMQSSLRELYSHYLFCLT